MSRERRAELLEQLVAQVPAPAGDSCVLVAIDGPDGSGKTTFADALAAAVEDRGRPVVRISADDFHHVRAIRYRRGRVSPVGFWLDSNDYERLLADVLQPLGREGSRRYRPKAHDLDTDAVLDPPWLLAEPGSVVIVDGLFLHRVELVRHWNFSLYLDVPFAVTAQRMAARDGTHPDPEHESMRRYVDAQRIYAAECRPQHRATVVIDNTDVTAPTVRARTPAAATHDHNDLTIETYEREIETYVAQTATPSAVVRRYLDDVAELVRGGHILELGSGPGLDADHLEALGVRVHRTDATQAFVERLRAAGHVAAVLDARDDDYGGPFDGVLADAVLLHLDRDQAEAALRRARRAVVTGGILAITLKEGDGSAWTTAKLGRPRRFTYWRADELTAALRRTGWDVLSLTQVQGREEPWLYVIARTRSPRRSPDPPRASPTS